MGPDHVQWLDRSGPIGPASSMPSQLTASNSIPLAFPAALREEAP